MLQQHPSLSLSLNRRGNELKKDTRSRLSSCPVKEPFLLLLLLLAAFVLDLDIERNFEGQHQFEEQVLENLLLHWEIYTRCTKRELKKEARKHKKRKRGRVLHQTTFF